MLISISFTPTNWISTPWLYKCSSGHFGTIIFLQALFQWKIECRLNSLPDQLESIAFQLMQTREDEPRQIRWHYLTTPFHHARNLSVQTCLFNCIQKYKNTKVQKNTKIQKYKNTKIQKYKNTKIQKYKNTKYKYLGVLTLGVWDMCKKDNIRIF